MPRSSKSCNNPILERIRQYHRHLIHIRNSARPMPNNENSEKRKKNSQKNRYLFECSYYSKRHYSILLTSEKQSKRCEPEPKIFPPIWTQILV
ncbi:hypothetical protein CEXT_132431 [Caerostris extrusa]|uniref:Uncharacterized protein n=1 Tax=Caerostris extrusa TaxID=172846 RepID=A0AAV4UA81_CAEEX|nr:hypothetical protein CEXT_132431 [Caerostris extrusa]